MKGIILAGGSGTRLYPLTRITSKQLLPVYDKPMIYYPLATLMQFGIREILIISTPADVPNIEKLLGDGTRLGLSIQYAVQPKPEGIAQAFIIGANFIGNDNVCLILGDNIFYMGDHFENFRKEVCKNDGKCAAIFAYHVSDPERFGVVEFDQNLHAVSIEEKPKNPKSNYAAVGLYFYPSDVVAKAAMLKPSARGEYEITDLNNMYLKEGRMNVVPMGRGNAWLDAGTPDSLMDSSQYVQIIEQRQGLKIACIEEIAFAMGFIDEARLNEIISEMRPCNYRDYLIKVVESKHELY